MRYVVKVNNKEYDVEVEKLGGPYQSLSRSTVYMQGVPTQIAQPVAQPVQAPEKSQVAHDTTVSTPKNPPVTKQDVQSSGTSDVVSPMPGKVFKILAKQGDSVSEGQAIIILEAMKMENEIVAPTSGTIDSILVKEGDSVETDSVLAILK